MKINCESVEQGEGESSFIGGRPKLPQNIDIPKCELCSEEQSFLFQIAFPEEHHWSGMTLAVFICTSCVDERYLIPEMLQGPLQGVDIPDGFLESYQKNFRFVVFDTKLAELRDNYEPRVRYKPIELEVNQESLINCNKVGGESAWLLDDENPASYDGKHKMHFLLQLMSDTQFELLDDAPPMMELNLIGEPEPSSERYYQLFNGNAIYLFGTSDAENSLVYAITQI
jgi:hypothetical protein